MGDSRANPRRSRGFAELSRILLLNPSRVYITICKHRKKKFSIAFIKELSPEK